MNIQNTRFRTDDENQTVFHAKAVNKSKTNQKKGISVDGSKLSAESDLIAAKKEAARKRALKVVGEAFAGEQKIDDDIVRRRDKISSLRQEMYEANDAIKELEEARNAIRTEYGVSKNSEEEAELKILEKELRSQMPGSGVYLTKEDTEAIEKIKKKGLTEYQSRSLEMLDAERSYAEISYNADEEAKLESRIIDAIQLERLKSNPMLEATEQADAIMEAASEQAKSMLLEEARAHVEEEAREQKEKSQIEKEKQEEIQERIDASKEKKKQNEKLTEDILDEIKEQAVTAQNVDAAQGIIEKMMNKMALIEEDLKGAAIDEAL